MCCLGFGRGDQLRASEATVRVRRVCCDAAQLHTIIACRQRHHLGGTEATAALHGVPVAVGAALSILGLAGLVWSIVRVFSARRRTSDDEELRAVIQGVMPWNMGGLFVSVIGLMMVIVGIFLS